MPLTAEDLEPLAFFADFDRSTLSALAEKADVHTLEGGAALFRQGDPSTDLYVVLTGRLIVVRKTGDGEDVVGYVRAGEPIGEMSLLSGDAHSASAFALRDTRLFRLPAALFEDLFETRVDFASALARAILHRARHPTASFSHAPPRVFALVATSPSIEIERVAEELKALIARHGRLATIIHENNNPDAALFQQEARADIVLAPCRVGDSDWYRFVLRQSDRLFVFARRDARPPTPFPLSPTPMSPARRFRLVDLVAVHEGQGNISLADWVSAVEANRIFHWRDEETKDRLARAIIGRTVALVLSGGGARAYAHVGVLAAMRERGLPVDFVGGASMGAIIAACLAMGWGPEEIDARLRDAFVDSNPLSDHVMPVVALTKGERVDERLKRHFGDTLIENLSIPFFCVSSELTGGRVCVHRRGLLRRALRASISLPGVLPPVVEGRHLLVDGAVLNNFPTDLMVNVHRGLTIGVDVAREGSISNTPFIDPPNFIGWVRRHGLTSAPPIVSLLMRSATARRDDKDKDGPDVLVEPTAPGVDLRDWKKYDVSVANGYETAIAAFERDEEKLANYCIDAG
ncbi:MAG: patatin-like phospholipase family protein [Pseudomonadota bacterium]